MVIGSIGIILMVIEIILNGDIVFYGMGKQFGKYLEARKLKDTGDTIRVNDEIELWPRMIESLYMFLLSNEQYKNVQFGNDVIIKGNVNDYFRLIEFGKK